MTVHDGENYLVASTATEWYVHSMCLENVAWKDIVMKCFCRWHESVRCVRVRTNFYMSFVQCALLCVYVYERKYGCTYVYNGVYMTQACVRTCVVKWTYMCKYKCANMRTCTYSDINIHVFVRVYVLMLRYTYIYERTYMHSTVYWCIYDYICNYITTDIFEYYQIVWQLYCTT